MQNDSQPKLRINPDLSGLAPCRPSFLHGRQGSDDSIADVYLGPILAALDAQPEAIL